MAKHVFKRGQGIPDKRLLHPKRDWVIGLFLFGIVLTVGSIFSAQLFISNQDITTDAVSSGEQLPVYNQSLIQKVLDVYELKRNNFSPGTPSVENKRDIATTTSDTENNQETTEVIEESGADSIEDSALVPEEAEIPTAEVLIENQEEESEEDEPLDLQAS